MVGFNRRFSPLATKIKQAMGDGPMSMIYRVNAGSIPKDSWIQDEDIGGGRIVGEVCHFIDFMIFMNGSVPVRVYAQALQDPSNFLDTVNINLEFENGSIGTVCYFANGPKSIPKEYVEIYQGGIAARLMDYKEAEIVGGPKSVRKKLMSQDKGQRAMVSAFLASIKSGDDSPIPLRESLASSITTFGILESLRSGQPVNLTVPT